MRLSPVEGRVIGSLMEKQLTTPQQYPLTLNALLLACNQSSNRDPVVAYDERTVEDVLASLKDRGLVRFVHPSHGRSVIRYRQVLEEKLGLDPGQLSLLSVLLLRGAQTSGELRSRTERAASFDGITAIDRELERLSQGPEPLVLRLNRRPGQKEERWMQLLADPSDEELADPGDPGRSGPPGDPPPPPPDVVAGLAGEVAALRAEVADLRSALERISSELGL